MAFVLDASMAASWCFRDETTPHNQSVLQALRASYAEVPALWLVEIANVLAINERKGRITPAISAAFLEILAGLDIRVESGGPAIGGQVLLPLTRRYGLTAYDSAYLELAKRRGLPLATLDKDLIRAAPLEGVMLVAQP
jgi:predicted nucleic acid-binding protein